MRIHSFIPMACAECDDCFLFSGASSVPLCYIPFPFALFHQLVFNPPSLHLVISFLVYLSAPLFPNSCIILFWEFFFFHSLYMHEPSTRANQKVTYVLAWQGEGRG